MHVCDKPLTHSSSCPSCNRSNITASRDVVLRNQILKQQVYCINKATDPPNITYVASNKKNKRKATSSEKCTWSGKYDDLRAHLDVCEYELIDCSNDGCVDKIERHEIDDHRQVCAHRTIMCGHCNATIKATAMNNHLQQCPSIAVTCECGFNSRRQLIAGHREKDCPMTEIECEVIGCNAKIMRRDYEKHQDEAAKHHVRLLSATVKQLSNLVEPKPIIVKWRITDIAAKEQEAAVDGTVYSSPCFDVFIIGNQKLSIKAFFDWNKLNLFLVKNIAMSADKNPLDIRNLIYCVQSWIA